MSDLWKSSSGTAKIHFQASKQSFFQISTKFLFWLVEQFLPSFYECYAHVRCIFQSNQNFRYKLKHPTTRRNDYTTGESVFVGFKKIKWLHTKEPISAVKKSFCQTSTRLLFCLIEFFLCIFCARYTYVKCLLESRETCGIN